MLRQNGLSCQSSCEIDLRDTTKQMELLDKVESLKGRKRGSKRDPEAKKQLLIKATLDTIADIGVTDTTVSRICERSGLSRGMIHLHFGGKDNLLTAAAQHFSAQYYCEMDRMTDLGPDASPEDRVMAVIEADLSEALLNPRSTKIWHAFRGIASSNPGIARYSSTQDHRLVETLRLAFSEIAQQNGRDANLVDDATSGTLALMEGMWVNYLTDMQGFSRRRSVKLIRRFLCGLFPGKFKL
ncbi:TetR family transcriptional regulator C-terminal domain-containing protein [Ruegeria arenilitoris]|uniref:TetR family transcriptional regulator C-terminal domain-containing protein n=2 Tax=Ruegeria arenilitoris TaxID=1173585 RepID=UPI00147B2E21|nr:TetR family transcriptional regulator C-terminal domain-containing protein [Ruegeria arenilitoris]